MTCLDATFTLTPRSPLYLVSSQQYASLNCYGVDFLPFGSRDFSSLYSLDQVYFGWPRNADPAINYSLWANRRNAPHLEVYIDLTGLGTSKSLALVFGFEPGWFAGRVIVWNDAVPIADRVLAPGDNQLLIELESLDSVARLYFIHAGGDWFFNGISGYVV
jgi:hypothetical protein